MNLTNKQLFLAHLKICVGCRRRSVRGHISKTEQDRPIVTVEHYIGKLAPLILLPH